MTRHTRPISRLSSFGSPHVRRSFGKVAIRPFIFTFSRPLLVSTLFFPLALTCMCLTTPHPYVHSIPLSPSQPLHSPSHLARPTPPPLSPTFYPSQHPPLHRLHPVMIPPISCLAPALAHPGGPPVRLSSPLSLYRFCTLHLVLHHVPRLFGAASRHLARQRDKIPR